MPIMKRDKTNLLDSTGVEWFRQRVIGGYMLYNKELCRLDGLHDLNTIIAYRVTGEPDHVLINKQDIPGFSAFAYPQLGYRRLYNNLAGYLEYDPHGHGQGRRGLRPDSVRVSMSPASTLMLNTYPQAARGKYPRRGEETMVAVFKPNYDNVQDLDKLIEGDKLQVILNHDVMIEPSVAPEDEDYIVYCRQRACGRFNSKKEFKWYSDKYREAVLPLIGNYGVHK